MISDQVILTNQQALNLLFNVGGLMVLAFLIGFLFGVISESKLRDNLDKARDASQSGGLILRCQERHANVRGVLNYLEEMDSHYYPKFQIYRDIAAKLRAALGPEGEKK